MNHHRGVSPRRLSSRLLFFKTRYAEEESPPPSPDDQLHERGGPLVYAQPHRVQVELEEDAGCAGVVRERAGVVRDAVLVRVQRGGAWGDVSRRDYMEEVLVCHKC